jgi:hypothetical protein
VYNKLENKLNENLHFFDGYDFAIIMNGLAGGEIPMMNFLLKAEKIIARDISSYPKFALLDILTAYSHFLPKNKEIFQTLEAEILETLSNFEIHEIINLLQGFAHAMKGSYNLFMELDKAIGKNIDYVKSEEIVPILESFVMRGHFRVKFFILFQQKIKQNVKEFKLEDIAQILNLYTRVGVNYDLLYTLFEPILIENMYTLHTVDLVNIIVAYSNPHLNTKYHILGDLEGILLQKLEQNKLDLHDISEVLYCYLTLNKGSKSLMKALMGETEEYLSEIKNNSDLAKIPRSETVETDIENVNLILKLFKIFQLTSAESWFYSGLKPLLMRSLEYFSPNELEEMYSTILESQHSDLDSILVLLKYPELAR